MFDLNLSALNPFRRSGNPSAGKTGGGEAPGSGSPVSDSPSLWERGKDFFADTWESTRKTVGQAVDTGVKWGREKVEETLWGEYRPNWGAHGDRYENPDDVNVQREASSVIEARIARRAADEGKALGKLSSDDQARYRKLQAMIGRDPLATEALQTMLLDGRLPGGKDLLGRGTLLTNLAALCDQALPAGMEREALVSDLIQEMENPVAISQGNKNTCVATSATIDLALRSPAEFVRLVSGLASVDGKVKTAGGAVIEREPQWKETLGDRTWSTHLLSASLIELGNHFLEYDPVRDHNQAFGKDLYAGLFHLGGNRVLENLHGRDYDAEVVTRWNLDGIMRRMAQATAQGKRVPVGLAWGDSGHQVVVEAVKDGVVQYLNPHGNREKLPEADFRARLRSAHFH